MNIAIGVGLCMLSCAMAGLGMGLATGKAVDWGGKAAGSFRKNQLHPAAGSRPDRIYGDLRFRHRPDYDLYSEINRRPVLCWI